ncbi:MAG TPA: pyrroloquinoline quinone biosynthesis peptide chaperone PqqD [Candidatus Competibacteraceae bacterium]|nr:pyrroloquinoline quinone biosynthesis peptide chaperone PqqD [Candidatus Competibacteraceae bacterium]
MNPTTAILRLAPGYRLQWEEAQQADVLLYPEGMVTLNPSAAAILRLCDGSRDAAAIIATLEVLFPGVDLAADVREFLEIAHERGWIRLG